MKETFQYLNKLLAERAAGRPAPDDAPWKPARISEPASPPKARSAGLSRKAARLTPTQSSPLKDASMPKRPGAPRRTNPAPVVRLTPTSQPAAETESPQSRSVSPVLHPKPESMLTDLKRRAIGRLFFAAGFSSAEIEAGSLVNQVVDAWKTIPASARQSSLNVAEKYSLSRHFYRRHSGMKNFAEVGVQLAAFLNISSPEALRAQEADTQRRILQLLGRSPKK